MITPGDDIVGVKAAISGTITEVVEKSRTVGTTWTDGDRIGVTCEDDVNISYKYTGNLSSFAAFDENQSIYFPGKTGTCIVRLLSIYRDFRYGLPICITVETTSDKQHRKSKCPLIFFMRLRKPDGTIRMSTLLFRIR